MGRPPQSNLDPQLNNLLKIIGANLQEVRTDRKMTQATLAYKAKISLTTLNEIESKRFRDIRLSTLVSLTSPLKISLGNLIKESDVRMGASDQMKLLKACEDIFKIVKKIKSED